ncbi:hypothetical protein KSL88_14095 [Pectobacterium polaris]|uniref:hypothetical protein n=1 Tax=Pectobacterium polaris TaxID=2042057 RepID=UPI001CC8050E|nr:hypothetical protein [Pectobacterium polaris]UAY90660.1 hypothetical protein KSL88_14095 [Pectobacterium polaris]
MTWVVGGKHLFCARAISDVQVTIKLKNGQKQYYDAVRKVHKIGSKITILFADSIKLAFAIIDELQSNFLPTIDDRLYERPDEVMRRMVRHIKHYYKIHRTDIDNRVEFLVFISPTGEYTEFGMWKLVSPSFLLIESVRPFEMLELGSGSIVKDYRGIIEKNSQGYYLIDRGKGVLPDAVVPVGRIALQYIFAEAIEYQNAGISKPMHIMLITHNDVIIDELSETPGGVFPSVANSWNELIKIMKSNGIALAECYAFA